MVRSRIGSRPAPATAADSDALTGTDRRAAPSCASWLDALAACEMRPKAISKIEGPFAFVLEIVAPWIGQTARSVALGCLIALGGCDGGPRVELDGVVRDGRTGEPIAGATITTEDGRTLSTDEEGRFSVSASEGELVAARADGRCDAHARLARGAGEGRAITLNLFERIEVDDRRAQVGFDAEVRISVRTRCDEHTDIEWRQIAGPELGPERMRAKQRGRVLVIRTHPLEELVRLDDRVGVLALDRHGRGEYRFEVGGELGGRELLRQVQVTAAPTSAGLYQVPTGADLHLNGGSGREHAWTLLDRPQGSEASIVDPGVRVARLRPDRFGTYVVEHRPSGARMSVQAGAYEDVPRDCGREGCHATENDGWTQTAHASTFRRGLEGALGADFSERCWSCHATGVEPGVDNGGLHHTAARVAWHQPAPDAGVWEHAPRRIRRHGSVWCSACHGPGRIVPPQFRWQYGAKFQVGVCARCHDVDENDPDASHVSPHVDEWRLVPMSRFSRDLREDDPALREGCAQCHSAQGFVAWQRGQSIATDRDTVATITCAACHDPHDSARPRGLRVYDTVASIAGAPAEHLGTGAVCASCHRTGVAHAGESDAAPHAPQADVMLGRGARLIAPMDDGVHRHIANTCVRCHMTRPAERDPLRGRAGGHTFSIRARIGEPALSPAACTPCHGSVAHETIGLRDWNGDGRPGSVQDEHRASVTLIAERLRARIGTLALRDTCAPSRVAADVAEHDARLHLVDAMGTMLGDCDADGTLGPTESAVTSTALPQALGAAAYDLALLRSDGSAGLHNPAFAFRVLDGLARALP